MGERNDDMYRVDGAKSFVMPSMTPQSNANLAVAVLIEIHNSFQEVQTKERDILFLERSDRRQVNLTNKV